MDTGETSNSAADKSSEVSATGSPGVGAPNVPRRLYFPPVKIRDRLLKKQGHPLSETKKALPREGEGAYWVIGKKGLLRKCRYGPDRYWCPNCAVWIEGAPEQFDAGGSKIKVACGECKQTIDYLKK